MNTIYLTLIILILSPLILMAAHIVFLRTIKALSLNISNQKSLILCALLLNLPLLTIIFFINKTPSSLIYAFLVYNSLAYSYFHFFNMSETARRIKILLEIKQKDFIVYNDLTTDYKPDFIVKTRLKRLAELGQIKQNADSYTISGKVLLLAALFIGFCRKILGFDG